MFPFYLSAEKHNLINLVTPLFLHLEEKWVKFRVSPSIVPGIDVII